MNFSGVKRKGASLARGWREDWRRWPWKKTTITGFFLIVIFAVIFISLGQQGESVVETDDRPIVEVATVQELTSEQFIEIPGVVESANGAPLVARSGGRVSKVKYNLGSVVNAGVVIVEIDDGPIANPVRAQAQGAGSALQTFREVERQAIEAAKVAVALAEVNVAAAERQEPLTQEQAAIARRQAELAAEEARLTLSDARERGDDAVIRAADLASQAAGLAQDIATVGLMQANSRNDSGRSTAELNLASAQAGWRSTVAELASQRAQLMAQQNVASAQFRQQQVAAPVNGEIVRLTVRPGDFVTAGQVVGEIAAAGGAEVIIDVAAGVRSTISVGDLVALRTDLQSFDASIADVAKLPHSDGRWQVNLYITETPQTIYPNDFVTALLPVGTTLEQTIFVPLDAVSARQSGSVIFTVTNGDIVREVPVDIISYEGMSVEIRYNAELADRIVISGSNNLRHLLPVRVAK